MDNNPIMSFKSRIEGKNADVTIYPDRVEWGRASKMRPGKRSSEMIPISKVSSVTTKKDGFTSEKLTLICSGNTIEMRAGKGTIDQAKDELTRLILGSHPSQAKAPPPPPPSSSSGIPPAPPGTAAGWLDDPGNPGQLRYWDGNAWTDHTHGAGG